MPRPQEPNSTDASFTSATGSEDFASADEESGVGVTACLVRQILEQEVVGQVRTPCSQASAGRDLLWRYRSSLRSEEEAVTPLKPLLPVPASSWSPKAGQEAEASCLSEALGRVQLDSAESVESLELGLLGLS